MNNTLEHNAYNGAPSVEIINDPEAREAVHGEFEKLVTGIDENVSAETKEELKTVVDRKSSGDMQTAERARY